ncbi:MAG: ribose-5-phosphate isomerase RpiA [Anaerolineae bacterium]|nr:ribose-5-phosphate isomerase RpiA [Anaerolineae bacterium]
MSANVNRFKQQAAEKAVEYVQSGMVIGLGAGSTAILATRRIAHLLQTGELRDISGVPCARYIGEEAEALGIPLTTLEEHPTLDLTIDGADEVDPNLNLIKGGGGALTREKIVAQASRREIIVVDESKLVPALGTRWAVPIEVLPFGHGSQIKFLESLGASVQMRKKPDGSRFITDQENWILDCNFGPIANPSELADRLNNRAGIIEHGLFIGLATDVIVAGSQGIRYLNRATA